MSTSASTGIARRRAILRRGVIATLVVVCLAIFTGYFRESSDGPLHDAQGAAASVVAPVQEVATRALEPFRDAWGWATSLRDARDRAAALEAEVEELRGRAVFDAVREQRLAELEATLGVEPLLDTERRLGGYEPVTGRVIARSFTDWYRSARVSVGAGDGVVRNSPVVAGTQRGAALVGVVTSVSGSQADVAFITDGRTEVGAGIPEAGNFQGLVQSISPGQLRLSGVPRAAPVKALQSVVTAGWARGRLKSIYPPGIPIGQVTSVGGQEVDVQQTVQVTPYVDPRTRSYLTVLVPTSPEAKERAAG
ncbi:rod shape-determining protein MreC [Miltoncostaea marina]|uniref:rod shape-determining protein MreC n=1 Tax=Miltoncostaea marina TaxID=2843215 RepID=UPI001C3DD093|nr:rod shape-determining protein MreC [Miltoncostaea marina]